jgi:hypothetical protein
MWGTTDSRRCADEGRLAEQEHINHEKSHSSLR